MKNLFNQIKKNVSALVIITSLSAALAPVAGHADLLGTTADGLLNLDGSSLNYFDLSAVPGSAPVSALVVDPNVEYTGNQPSLQTTTGITAHISADIGAHEILLTWINSGLHVNFLPDHVFVFDLFPPGQQISGVLNDFGLPPSGIFFTGNEVSINYGAFVLGQGQSALAHYTLSFINVPEPETYLLLGSMAIIALFAARRRGTAIRAS